MLKTFSNKTCAFDCEWTPCADTARRLLHLPADCSDREAFDAVWRAYAKEEGERPFLKLCLSKVVTIAAVFRDATSTGAPKLELFSQSCDEAGEAALIAGFLERVASGTKWQLWGYNSASADVPILKQRALVLDAPIPAFSWRPPRPWEGMDYHDARNSEAHMDLLDMIGAYGNGAAKPRLHELAVACGFPGKLETAGDDVADLYLEGRIDDILQYNETDAVTTHLLMLRTAHVCGKLADTAYAAELDAVERLVRAQIAKGKGQFSKFLDAWKGGSAGTAYGARFAAAVREPADPALATKLLSHWKEMLSQVKAEVGMHQSAALQAVRDICVEGGTATLYFGNNEFSRSMCEKEAERIAAILAQYLDAPAVTLCCELGDKAPADVGAQVPS